MTSLVGTRALLRLALRRDRIKLPAWIVSLVVLAWVQGAAIEGLYPDPQDRVAYASTTASSAPARLFGAVDGPALGSIMMNELYVFFAIAIALLCSMLVVRHTRQNEETGRLELIRSTEVGRHASLAAALLLAAATCALLFVALGATLAAIGLPPRGSLLMAAAWAGTGLAFTGVAAIASQLAVSARMANGIAGGALAAAFALRAAGDVFGDVSADRLHVAVAWPSWLSPIGWGQLAYPFSDQRAWALAPYALAFASTVVLAVAMSARRDFGRGMLPERGARPRAAATLAGPLALAVRLHRTTILSWTIGLVAMGAIGGVFSGEVEEMLGGSDEARALLEALGGSAVVVDAYFAGMIAYIGLLAAAMALQVATRLRSEERGPGEAVLATGVGRVRFMWSHLLVAAVAAAVGLLLAGAVMELLTSIAGEPVDRFQLVAGSLAQLPAVLVYVAAVALGFGLSSRLAGWFGWSLFAVSVLVLLLSVLDLPEWAKQVSPLEHAPAVPVEQVEVVPLVASCVVAAAAVLVGLARFRVRDVDSGA